MPRRITPEFKRECVELVMYHNGCAHSLHNLVS